MKTWEYSPRQDSGFIIDIDECHESQAESCEDPTVVDLDRYWYLIKKFGGIMWNLTVVDQERYWCLKQESGTIIWRPNCSWPV